MVLIGCWNPFAPTEGLLEGGSSLTLTEQRSPDEVLQNFRYAYIYRDSLVYSELFDICTNLFRFNIDNFLDGKGDCCIFS